MATKRKGEEVGVGVTTPAKITKPDEAGVVSRSGRVRKKPARFKDTEGDFDEESMLVSDSSKKSSKARKVIPDPVGVIEENNSDPSPKKLVKSPASSAQQQASLGILETSISPVIGKNLLIQDQSPGLEDLMVVQNAAETVQQEPAPTPKGGRVRKKSAKVLEMEEFEEVEKKKTTTKKAMTPSATHSLSLKPVNYTAVPVPTELSPPVKVEPMEQTIDTSLIPQTLPKPAIVGKMDPALANLPPFPPSKLGSQTKKSKKKEEPSNLGAISNVIPPLPPPSILSPQSGKKSKASKSPARAEPLVGHIDDIKSPGQSKKKAGKNSASVKAENKAGKTAAFSSIGTEEHDSEISSNSEASGKSVIKMLLSSPSNMLANKMATTSKQSDKSNLTGVPSTSTSTVEYKDDRSHYLVKNEEEGYEDDMLEGSNKSSVKKEIKKTVVMYPGDTFLYDDDEDDMEETDDDDDDDINDPDDCPEWEFENQDGKLVIIDPYMVKEKEEAEEMEGKGKKKTKKGKTPKKSKDADAETDGQKDKEKMKKIKKKKRLTAYTMWCNSVRHKVLSEHNGMDFAQLSRRLGEIWHSVPAKEKMAWKRKAKREARKLFGKGLLISTSKQAGGVIHTSIPSPSAVAAAAAAASSSHHGGQSKALVSPQSPTTSSSPGLRSPDDSSKMFGIKPIDVSAHLKLLGDSLSIIGMRLQEHRGLIAVQGSLSVLLDSMLCALGPLMCLTTQIPELHGCAPEVHARTLDNIAYFMPGL